MVKVAEIRSRCIIGVHPGLSWPAKNSSLANHAVDTDAVLANRLNGFATSPEIFSLDVSWQGMA